MTPRAGSAAPKAVAGAVAGIVSVAEMRARARSILPRPVFDFADGGAEDERTLRRNEEAFAGLALLPRPLNGAAERDLSVELFGRQLALPLILGPVGLAGLYWPDGECAAALAAGKAGTAICLSHGSVCTLERFAEAAGAARWMQVFIYRDRGFTRELAARAAASGYEALVLTIDNQLLGNRDRDRRNGFAIPPHLTAGTVAGMARKWRWLWRMRGDLPRITFGNYARPGEQANVAALAARMGSLLDPAMTWRDVEELRQTWKGPLLLKGVLHPAEALEAVASGVDGIIVSNHGGRQLDGAPASIEALPAIVAATGGKLAVLLDGGVRRGADVVKALALGARACLVGRPWLWGLAVGGEAGVAQVLEMFRSEIDRVMGLCGISRIDEISAELLFR